MTVIEALYPKPTDQGEADSAAAFDGTRQRVVEHHGRSEIVVAVDFETLVREARWADGVIEFVPQVGDFVATGEPLFVLYGGAIDIRNQLLRTTVAFGPERTMEQDPMFSFRILVDIALKALSPAINDPTTAVLVLDQVHRLLRVVGRRHLQGEVIRDLNGTARVIHRTRTGKTSCRCPVTRSARTAPRKCRWHGGCGRCSRTSSRRCRQTGIQRSTTNVSGWTTRSPPATRSRPTCRWRVSPTRKASGEPARFRVFNLSGG
jgi:hypothetical protein